MARMGENKISYMFPVGKTEGKRLLGRPCSAWKDNVNIHFKDVGIDRYGINLTAS